jgi:hypothetical protein
MRRITRRTLCTAESTTESRSAISHTFHNVVEKRNPYRYINRRQLHEPTPASLLSPPYNMPYLSRCVMALSWILRIRVRQLHSAEYNCHNLTSTKLITAKYSETQPRITSDIGKILLIEMGRGLRRSSAQYTSNFEKTVCSGEKTMESRSAISSTFLTVVEKRNLYRFKNWL